MSNSSRPINPPSPACGFNPATAMCGAWPVAASSASWVMRKVCKILSTVTASIAWRIDTWMLTNTVLSSGLANIMRTGISSTATPAWAAAQACSISVWPGNGTPATLNASLCKGAVTTADSSPRKAALAAHTTQSAASLPAVALMRPHAGNWSAGNGGVTCNTGIVKGTAK